MIRFWFSRFFVGLQLVHLLLIRNTIAYRQTIKLPTWAPTKVVYWEYDNTSIRPLTVRPLDNSFPESLIDLTQHNHDIWSNGYTLTRSPNVPTEWGRAVKG